LNLSMFKLRNRSHKRSAIRCGTGYGKKGSQKATA
jgi:hypothetical protein